MYTIILSVVLGWLFGLLSPIIVDAVRHRRKSKILKRALCVELHEFQYLLLLTVFRIEIRHGEIKQEFLKWARSILKGYEGINSSEPLIKATRSLSKLSEKEMFRALQSMKQAQSKEMGLSLKKHSLPLLQSKAMSFTHFDSSLQSRLLDIERRIGFLNEIVDDAKFYFQLSFRSGITSENYAIANTNMVREYKNYAKQARIAADNISEILKLLCRARN